MRKIAVGVVALAAALSVGCSDDKADGGGAESGGAFCDGLRSFSETGNAESLGGDEGLAAVEELTALEPPAEIADDFATFVSYLETVAAGEVPDEATTTAWNEATARIDTFAVEECGLTE